MARLDREQVEFMKWYRQLVVKHGKYFDFRPLSVYDFKCLEAHVLYKTKIEPILRSVNRSQLYHDRYWYTSQLFDPDWTPRVTLEHAPPMPREHDEEGVDGLSQRLQPAAQS
jgi:hypothetical protein